MKFNEANRVSEFMLMTMHTFKLDMDAKVDRTLHKY